METNNFHFLVGEMTVTLDDVVCLLDILILGRLIAEEDIHYEDGMELLQIDLGFTKAKSLSEVTKKWGGYVTITHLKESYDRLLNKCNQLEQFGDEEEVEEQEIDTTICIKAFLLLLVDLTIFADNNSKNIHLILFPKISVIGGYMTLIEVISLSLSLSLFSITYHK